MVSNTWQPTTLGDAVSLLTGFPFQSSNYTTDLDGIPLVRGDNVVQGRFRWEDVKRWPCSAAFTAEELKPYFLEPFDVVLAMDRPWIEAGLKYASVSVSETPCLLVQRVARLRAKEDLDQRFLYYIVGSKAFTDHILGVQTGTAVPHISGSQIRQFQFLCPPLSEQQAIARILGALDDKIELNRRQNATLEALARAIFQSWFVDFDPVRARTEGGAPAAMDAATAALFPDGFDEIDGREVPRGWELKPIGDVTRVIGGSTPSTQEPTFWEGGIHHWVTPKDLSSLSAVPLLDTERRITDAGLSQISSGLLPKGTVLLSSRAPIGYTVIAEIPVAINQGFIAMVCDRQLPNHYVLWWTRTNIEEIKGRANGTTFLEISKSNFRPMQVIIPSELILKAFVKAVEPLYQKVRSNLQQSRTLVALRDALLPKLLSGEIRVRDAEALVDRQM